MFSLFRRNTVNVCGVYSLRNGIKGETMTKTQPNVRMREYEKSAEYDVQTHTQARMQ